MKHLKSISRFEKALTKKGNVDKRTKISQKKCNFLRVCGFFPLLKFSLNFFLFKLNWLQAIGVNKSKRILFFYLKL